MRETIIKNQNRARRHKKIRATIEGTKDRPRLSIFRSNKYIYAQLIDDNSGKTLASGSSKGVKGKTMKDKAEAVGEALAKIAKEQKIEKVVFDRGGYVFTGRVKALAEGARRGGLVF